jgi:pimeloyl-ACP methyl ester carboxylesterase
MLVQVDAHPVFYYHANRAFNAAQPNAVFIHGAAHDHSVWALQSRYFAYHSCNVFALDLPGHGRSGGAPLASVEESARWLTRFLDAAGIAQSALIGHSMGSLIALEAAALAPQRVSKLALLGTAAPMAVGEGLLNAARANSVEAHDMVTIWGHRSRAGANPNPGMWMLGYNLRLNERAANDVLFTDLNACNNYKSALERAAQIQCPALVLSGTRDIMTPPKAAQALAKALPNARYVSVEAGHALMSEQPDAALDALRGFL